MNAHTISKHVLIIHGPNMNLLGYRKIEANPNITLDKLNRNLRKVAKSLDMKVKIIQTNDETKAATTMQRQRNKINGILFFPGPWQKSGHVLQDTLKLLSIPFVTISVGEQAEVLQGSYNIYETDLYKASEMALTHLSELI